MMQELIQGVVDLLVTFATSMLLPTMVTAFIAGAFFRALIYFTIQREMWFAKEFQRRVEKFMAQHHDNSEISFFIAVKKMLEKTFYEAFIVRSVMKRRKPDHVMSIMDRVFLIQQGSAFLVRDTLKQIKFLRRDQQNPKLLEISKSVLQNNPCFNKVFGIVPINVFNDVLNILPGLFIVGGIFGTFLGIMKALPELSGMDLEDIEGTKAVMDTFLLKISFSMSTSIIGIVLSVSMNVINTFLHPEKLFMDIVEKYENSLDVLWNRSTNNHWTEEIAEFDEHKDPLDALAEDSLAQELDKADKKSGGKGYKEVNVKNYDIKNVLVDNTREPKEHATANAEIKKELKAVEDMKAKKKKAASEKKKDPVPTGGVPSDPDAVLAQVQAMAAAKAEAEELPPEPEVDEPVVDEVPEVADAPAASAQRISLDDLDDPDSASSEEEEVSPLLQEYEEDDFLEQDSEVSKDQEEYNDYDYDDDYEEVAKADSEVEASDEDDSEIEEISYDIDDFEDESEDGDSDDDDIQKAS